jgi:hypothetical protein
VANLVVSKILSLAGGGSFVGVAGNFHHLLTLMIVLLVLCRESSFPFTGRAAAFLEAFAYVFPFLLPLPIMSKCNEGGNRLL